MNIKSRFFKALIFLWIIFFSCNCFAYGEEYEVYEVDNTPWSGYWWPWNECGLGTGGGYFGHPSPLEKYEQYLYGFYPQDLTRWYTQNHCSETYPGWYGHCGHFSLAASWEHIDIYPSTLNNIVFRVGDKKGLLTLLHTNDIASWGNATTPDGFHLWLLKYIKDQKQAFVADMDPGEEVWQYPIYKYEMTTEKSAGKESVHVKVYCASDSVHQDYIGTYDRFYIFDYDLYINDQDEITGGEWTGESIDQHPERMFAVIMPKTDAPIIDGDTVRQIAASKDDELEKGLAQISIAPGSYNLVLLDPDFYSLNPQVNETFSLKINSLERRGISFKVTLYDGMNRIVAQQTIDEETPFEIVQLSQNPPYSLQVYKTSYDIPGIYNLKYDNYKEYSQTMPYIPKDGKWSGFAITNPSEEILEKVEVTSYTKDGEALQTLLGPLSLSPGEKKRFLLNGLPYREHEYIQLDSVRVSSNKPSGIINIIGNYNSGSASSIQREFIGSHLAFPDTVMELQQNAYMIGRIVNESTSQSACTLYLYTADGVLMKTHEITLNPREFYQFNPGIAPFFSTPEGGWVEIKGSKEQDKFSGYEYIQRDKSIEISFASPANMLNKVVPHIPLPNKWEAELILINTSNTKSNMRLHLEKAGLDTTQDVTLTFAPKEKRIVDLDNLFGMYPQDKYYHSILSVSSDQEYVGYYRYQALSYEDSVIIPLLDENDFSSILLLGHNTVQKEWWTGVGIFNPMAQTVSVNVKPYDTSGNFMADISSIVTLTSGAYEILSIEGLYKEKALEIAFIRFETVNPNHQIGGFFLHASELQGICGGNLQKLIE